MRALNISSALVLIVACLTGCGEGLSEQEAAESDLGTDSSTLAALEYKIATHFLGVLGPGWETARASTWHGVVGYSRGSEVFILLDLAEDSMSVGVHWRTATRRGICRSPYGQGSAGACNYNFADGQLIEFRVGRCNGSAGNCDDLDAWKDWSSPFTSVRN